MNLSNLCQHEVWIQAWQVNGGCYLPTGSVHRDGGEIWRGWGDERVWQLGRPPCGQCLCQGWVWSPVLIHPHLSDIILIRENECLASVFLVNIPFYITRSSVERRTLRRQSWTSTTVGSTGNPFTQSSPPWPTSGKLVVASMRWGESLLWCAGNCLIPLLHVQYVFNAHKQNYWLVEYGGNKFGAFALFDSLSQHINTQADFSLIISKSSQYFTCFWLLK